MEQDYALSIFLLVVTIVILVVQIYKNNELSKENERLGRDNKYLEDRIAKRDIEGERNFKDLVAGIDGVTSVSLSAKRYVELLKAENDLVDLKVKMRELGDG